MSKKDTTYKINLRHQQEDDQLVRHVLGLLLQSWEGRKFLHWLLTQGNPQANPMYPQPFTGESLSTAYQCGIAQVGNLVGNTILEVNPDAHALMLKEATNERETRRAELAGAEPERGTPDSDYGPDGPEIASGADWDPFDGRG